MFLPVLFSLSIGYFAFAQEKYSFIGADACGMCHKTEKQGKQLDIWKQSAHAQAFKTLQTDKANEIAKGLGHLTPAAETQACLKCHTSGSDVDKSLLGAKFKMEDGVQCETCHGPGSAYKDIKVMKSREESVKKGLVVHEKLESFCVTCHNSESPTFKEINVTEAWEKIKHEVPKTK
ncbi:MAG: cytochrome C554 [Ignavibacteriales bacterium]|nr:MAG: cytochrome C554 [Ignavibacteriales bacterium]